MIIVYNDSQRAYVHEIKEGEGKIKVYRLNPKSKLSIPDEVAKIWLKSKEIMEVVKDDKDAKIAELEAKLAAKEQKPAKKTTKKKK